MENWILIIFAQINWVKNILISQAPMAAMLPTPLTAVKHSRQYNFPSPEGLKCQCQRSWRSLCSKLVLLQI